MPKKPEAPEGLLRPSEFAALLKVSRATVYRYMDQGLIEKVHLPVAKPGKNARQGAARIPVKAAEAFMESLRRSA